MKVLIYILGICLATGVFASDEYAACITVCTDAYTRPECLADCASGSTQNSYTPPRKGDRLIQEASLPDPMEMLSSKSSLQLQIDAATPAATNPKNESMELGGLAGDVKVVGAATGLPGQPAADRAATARDGYASAEQGASAAVAQQSLMIGQAIALLTSNPSPVEVRAADQLLAWGQAQGEQSRASRLAANKNWEQCVMLKGPNGCVVPSQQDEFVVSRELADQLATLGIGRLEFQGKVQSGDWAWIRSALNVTSADLSEDEEAAAQALANGSGFVREPSSSHAANEDRYSPPQVLQADAISYGASAPNPPSVQDAPPSDSELRAAGIVPLPPTLSLFTFASRKFTNWRRGNR